MGDMERGCDRLLKAISAKEPIVVYGDYDVDGVMATVILVKGLSELGANVSFYIPHREDEGYGLNMAAVESLQGSKLLLLADNGIAAVSEIDRAKQLGMDVVVLDHHEPGTNETGEILPDAIIIDPKRRDCSYPFKSLCSGGLAFLLVRELFAKSNRAFLLHDELMIFSMLATICDIVELVGENRIIAANGLGLINSRACVNLGLRALISLRGLASKRIDTFSVGFVLGPCINATGRLESARLSVELFLTENAAEAKEKAARLVELNEQRKNQTTDGTKRLLDRLVTEANQDSVLVIYDEEVHESIAGIVAGRVKERTNRPTILITRGKECPKGSGRSIPGYNLFEALNRHRDLFERFGGHAMAAGLSISRENIDILRLRLNEDCNLTEEDLRPTYYYDAMLDLDEVGLDLACELNRLSPFGQGNKEPVFAAFGVSVISASYLGANGNTLKLMLRTQSGKNISAVGFGIADLFREKFPGEINQNSGISLDILYNITINSFNDNTRVELRLVDFV